MQRSRSMSALVISAATLIAATSPGRAAEPTGPETGVTERGVIRPPAPLTAAEAAEGEWIPGEVLVKIRADAFEASAYKTGRALPGRTGVADLDGELSRVAASEVRNVFTMDVNRAAKQELGMDRIVLVRYTDAETGPVEAARLMGIASVEWAEPNGVVHGTSTPNDPFFNQQWAHYNRGKVYRPSVGDSVGTPDCDLDTPQGWNVQTGAYNVVIAMLDTGIDRGHPEFANKVLAGWDFINNDSDPNDDLGHGTCTAGIAAAIGNNGVGVAGVDWGAAILPVKVLDSSNNGSDATTAAGMQYAADFGAKVLSMSLGGTNDTATLHTATVYAYNAGCVVVAAAGNNNVNGLLFPAGYYEAIGVGALSPCNERKYPGSCDGDNTWGSNFGVGLEIMAPGVLIASTDIRSAGGYNTGGDYVTTFNGTSAATPFVSGVAALVRSQNINLTPSDVATILVDACDDLGFPGYDYDSGFGRLNAYAALRRTSGAVFVGQNGGTEYGTYSAPYHTLLGGINAVAPGNWVVVRPGSYDEVTPLHWNKQFHLDAIDANVHVH